MITDYDGNEYTAVMIGTQEWLIENLKTTHYNDGTPIPNLTTPSDWAAENGSSGHDGAFRWPGDNIANKALYGALYNGYAINNPKGIAPDGFRVPTASDWARLKSYLGNAYISGGRLKEAGTSHWHSPNEGATDEYGFKALPGTGVSTNGTLWTNYGYNAYFWASDYFGLRLNWETAEFLALSSPPAPQDPRYGFAVRCVRDKSINLIKPKRIKFNLLNNPGVYLRWWFNGWHYWHFTNGYEIEQRTKVSDVMIQQKFSVISHIERPTGISVDYSYRITIDSILPGLLDGFTGLLIAERVEQYENSQWNEVKITRGPQSLKEDGDPAYNMSFEITRFTLTDTPATKVRNQLLYIGDTLCDIDDDEVIPINKQVNNIAEMQDRQSDFTSQFKVRKTRAMMALFELSGEVGANTTFPYERQTCRLIQEGIEIISDGYAILDRVADAYYYISIYSGNLNFFKELAGLKISNLTLASCNHTWNVATMAGTHSSDLNYLYPLLEPSNDGGIAPLTDNGSRVNIPGEYIWPFIKLKAIWDEIISATGFTAEGDILTNDRFLKMFMPIANRNTASSFYQYYYILYNNNTLNYSASKNILPGGTLITGDSTFAGGIYITPCQGKFKFKVVLMTNYLLSAPLAYLRVGVTDNAMTKISETQFVFVKICEYEYEADLNSGDNIRFVVGPAYLTYNSCQVVNIIPEAIGYGSAVTPNQNLPDMTQIDFIKMICNIFGLIPEAKSRDRKIKFWNYLDLYNNIPQARDWSAYLSEDQDEVKFKFGDYAQNNNMKFRESKDVTPNYGNGRMIVEDDTLPDEKDILELPVSATDEVTILTDQTVSRIAFNEFDPDSGTYKYAKSVDPRIVYMSVATGKTLGLQDTASPPNTTDIVSPKKVSVNEISMSAMAVNYSGLSRLLTRANLRRAKFNLPVYEVAGLRHDIPIYLSQYKAYFYVNKINNYIPGKLCVIDIIKL